MRIRCDHGGVVGLITNRHFCNLDWAQQVGRKLAVGLLEKDGDARGLLDIAPSDARDLLLPAVPQIIKSQRSTGLWRIKNARGISLSLLKAMKHAELLKTVLPQLRHDPYQPFLDAEDWHGIAARHQLLKRAHPKEQALKNRLLKEMGGRQCANGSWDGTVSATVHHLEILAECGLAETKQFARGIAYLFECLQPELRRRDCVVAHDMISSPDCKAEFQSTLMYHPDWIPHPACHSHLPVIQTGYALRLLNKVGYENDKRVKAACQNMVDLHDRFGGWCCSNIRTGLNAEAAESRQRQALVPKPLPRTRK